MNPLRIQDKDKNDQAAKRINTRGKPTGPANSSKDFNEVMRNQENDGVAAVDDTQSSDETTGQPSLFDLSAQSRKSMRLQQKEELAAGEDVAKMASSDEIPTESSAKSSQLKDLYAKLAMPKEADQKQPDLYAQADSKAKDSKFAEEVAMAKGDIHEKEQKSPSFARESTDLSYVNPLSINTQNPVESVIDQTTATPAQKMTTQQLVDAIVKAISTVAYEGKTDTVVTLKQPPMFEGANVVLTSYESAKGEFNIRFENLTQQAKSFMDMQQNKDSLTFALQQKGYAVHILVNTTQIESPRIIEEAQQTQRDQSPEEQQQNRKQKKQQE